MYLSKYQCSVSEKCSNVDMSDMAQFDVEVSSDPTELQSMALSIRKGIITTSESTDRSFPYVITMPDIKSAVKKLRAGNQAVLVL